VEVSSRRFDTSQVLQHIIEGDNASFGAFYERYRGRVYRFIVRLYGTGNSAKLAYYSAWRHLIVSSRHCKIPKELKYSFYRNLWRSTHNKEQRRQTESQSTYLPRNLEEDSQWSVVFIEQFRRLPEKKMKLLLFRYEFGLSNTAIALIFEDTRYQIEDSLDEAEQILRTYITQAGCPDHLDLDRLYRESQVVKPPAHWDSEILDSFAAWMKQEDNPTSERNLFNNDTYTAESGFQEMLSGWITSVKQRGSQLKTKVGTKGKKSVLPPNGS
jgi:DNA-directed RNA polymerase specialized sigma24 family protein